MAVIDTSPPQRPMSADEFLAWSDAVPGLFELHDGTIIEVTAQTLAHAEVKSAAHRALIAAIAQSGLPYRALPDGMAVRTSKSKVYKPDAIVYCGPRPPPDTREITEPVVIVEVLSDSTRNVDLGEKGLGYFSLPSVQHYIVIDPEQRPVMHQARQSETSFLTRLLHTGKIELSPPGLTIDIDDLFA